MGQVKPLLLCCGLVLLPGLARAQNQDLALVNLDTATAPALAAAATEAQLKPLVRLADEAMDTGIVAWQVENKPAGSITPARAQKLEDWLRDGGRLLLTLADTPGDGAFRLSPALPTTAWQSFAAHKVQRDAAKIAAVDGGFFGAPIGGQVPYYYEIRPFHTVERGQARYEKFARPVQRLVPEIMLPAGNEWWTRPLINRDWQVRVAASDVGHTPLLITGRYGAGRVAVWSSSVEGLADSPETRNLWKGVLKWLAEKPASPAPTPANFTAPSIQVDTAQRVVNVQLANPGAAALPVQVVARVLSWEDAPVGDGLREATLPPNGRATVSIPLPAPGQTNYQELDDRDAFVVRLGILSGDGRKLLSESRVPVDLRPALRFSLATDEERSRVYPFDAPLPGKDFRLGTPMPAYAYRPGNTINARVEISNGLKNLAPSAKVSDLTTANNASVMALSDGAVSSEKGPLDKIEAYGTWNGAAKQENVLRWEWASPVTVAAVVITGAADSYRAQNIYNPPAIVLEADGKEVAREMSADPRFLETKGRLRLAFAPVKAKSLTLRLPWVEKDAAGKARNQPGVRLGEVEIEGTDAGTIGAAQKGSLSVVLRDAFSGRDVPMGSRDVTVPWLGHEVVSVPVTLPAGERVGFYRLEAKLTAGTNAETRDVPVLAINPSTPLQPITVVHPPEGVETGFIVTRGFRLILNDAVGTAEIGPGWGQPDDLVWAYAHGFKQNNIRLRTQAGRLYVSENDMRHYSTPWRPFFNGEEFYSVAAPLLVQRMREFRNWEQSKTVVLAHSDRWDTGPPVGAMHSWQDYEAFNDWLIKRGKPGLTGRTLTAIAKDIEDHRQAEWQAWHLEKYLNDVHTLREAFAKEGKQLAITAQGVPLVPPSKQTELTEVIKGMSDDTTWGMEDEDFAFTTGRQMGILAFNSEWKMATLLQWGWDSAELDNAHWHSPVGTTEPSRRIQYDRAFRGVVRADGRYTSMQQYGYNTNGGFSYTMTPNDFTQWNQVQERFSLLTPEAPLGAGLVLSSSRLDDPKQTAFDGTMNFGLPGLEGVHWTQVALRRLHEGGLSVPFSTNAANLQAWKGNAPLVVVNLWEWNDRELAALKSLSDRGVPIAALGMPEGKTLPVAAAVLFGVTSSGAPAEGKEIAQVDGKPVVALGNRTFVPVFAGTLTGEQGRQIAPLLRDRLNVPLQFPDGTAGYGFISNGQRFVVLEDWMEAGRVVPLRVRSDAAILKAVNVNEHTPLTTHRDGADWVIDVPVRPGDGVLVAIQEGAQ